MPILMYKTELGSSIHPEHINTYHEASHKALWNFWTTSSSTVDIKDYMNYDPYLGRITEPSGKRE